MCRFPGVTTMLRFFHPQAAVRLQRLPVHEQRLDVGQAGPEPVKNAETVSIDVAPIPNVGVVQPRHVGQLVYRVAETENDDAAGQRRERQTVDAVFGDEYSQAPT